MISDGHSIDYAMVSTYHDSNSENDRRMLNEILITAVVFGLTLNLISDLISSLPTLILQSDFLLLGWKFVWFFGSLVATILLLSKLSTFYLGDESRVEREYRMALVWNFRSGEIYDSMTTYRPQLVGKAIIDELDENAIQDIQKVVTAGPDSLRKSEYPLKFGESILIKALSDISNIDFEQLQSKHVSDLIPEDPIALTLFNRSICMWGKWTASYEKLGSNESRIEIKWPKFPRGSMIFELKVGQVDWFDLRPEVHLASYDTFYSHEFGEAFNEFWQEVMKIDPYGFPKPPTVEIPEKEPTGWIRSDIHLKIRTNFSPLGLQRGWGETEALVKWADYILSMIQRTLDWSSHLEHILLVNQKMFGKGLQE